MDGKRRQHRDTATTRLFQKCFLPIHSRPPLYYYSAATTTTTTAAAPVRREGSFLYFSLYCLLHRRWERRAANSRHTHTQKPRNVIYVQNRVETLKHGNSSNSVEEGVVQRRGGELLYGPKTCSPPSSSTTTGGGKLLYTRRFWRPLR